MNIKRKLSRRIARNLKKIPEPVKEKVRWCENYFSTNPEFVIVSTGRAGSTFSARLLCEMNILCSHETFFKPSGFERNYRFDGDSSWLAVPYLEDNPTLTKRIVHQVRHPLDVISSLKGIGFFSDSSTPYRKFARRNFSLMGDELIDCMRWWTEWNERCASIAHKSLLFEDIVRDCSLLVGALGYSVDLQDQKGFLQKLAKEKINARERSEVKLGDLPAGADKDKMISLAKRYGYNL